MDGMGVPGTKLLVAIVEVDLHLGASHMNFGIGDKWKEKNQTTQPILLSVHTAHSLHLHFLITFYRYHLWLPVCDEQGWK